MPIFIKMQTACNVFSLLTGHLCSWSDTCKKASHCFRIVWCFPSPRFGWQQIRSTGNVCFEEAVWKGVPHQQVPSTWCWSLVFADHERPVWSVWSVCFQLIMQCMRSTCAEVVAGNNGGKMSFELLSFGSIRPLVMQMKIHSGLLSVHRWLKDAGFPCIRHTVASCGKMNKLQSCPDMSPFCGPPNFRRNMFAEHGRQRHFPF